MEVTEDMRHRAVDALDACRETGQPWWKLLANEVVDIVLAAAIRVGALDGLDSGEENPDPERMTLWRIGSSDLSIWHVGEPPTPYLREVAERKEVVDAAAYVELCGQYDELLAAVPWREIADDLKKRS